MFFFDKIMVYPNKFIEDNTEIILLKKTLQNKNLIKINININILYLTPYIGYFDNSYKYAQGWALPNVPIYIDSNNVISFYHKKKGIYDYNEGIFLDNFSEEWGLKVFFDLNTLDDLNIFITRDLFLQRFKLIKRFKRKNNKMIECMICQYKDVKVSFNITEEYENEDDCIFLVFRRLVENFNGEKVYCLEFR